MYDSVELETENIFPSNVAQVKAKALKHWVQSVFFIMKIKLTVKKEFTGTTIKKVKNDKTKYVFNAFGI